MRLTKAVAIGVAGGVKGGEDRLAGRWKRNENGVKSRGNDETVVPDPRSSPHACQRALEPSAEFAPICLLMRYIGSKVSTLPWLTSCMVSRAPGARSLCDPFAGACVVPRHFKQLGMKVVTGDVLLLSYLMQRATLGLDSPPTFNALRQAGIITADRHSAGTQVLAHLQALPGRRGYFHDEFSDGAGGTRRFFTAANAARIDAIRKTVADWRTEGLLTEDEVAFLLASLIDAADRVANTAGTYYAHLKSFVRRAELPLSLRLPRTTQNGSSGGHHHADAAIVAANTEADVLYLDPPYNERDYSGYYHLPETIARGDEPQPRGRSGAPAREQPRSNFYRRSQAGAALAQICLSARARHIVVHYTTNGTIPHETILDTLAMRGEVTFEDREVRAYSSRRGSGGKAAQHRLYWCRVTNGVT